MRNVVMTLAAMATLGGCVRETPAASACRADAVQDRIGQPYTEALGEAARKAAGAARLRVLRPGDMATMDFDPARLNVTLDEAGRVVRVGCN